MSAAPRRLRIAQVTPPLEAVPPKAYGGTERIVHELTRELVRRGHEVTVFASGDSEVPGRLVPTVPQALRPLGRERESGGWFANTVKVVLAHADAFDVIHAHLEWWSVPLAMAAPVPVVSTFHGRLDFGWARELFREPPEGMVAISRSQASSHPRVPWTIIHNGLTLDHAPFREDRGEAFCFVGRVEPEKGILEAMEIARLTGRPLKIAAKVGNLSDQRAYHEEVFLPVLRRAGRDVEYLGELAHEDRDALFAESYATLMPIAWPEPFGLVSIESLACGTPILARPMGALPEIIRDGADGFFGDDATALAFQADGVAGLDRRAIRERVIERFSAARMADRYEELYARTVGRPLGASPELQAILRRPAAGRPGPADAPEAAIAAARAGTGRAEIPTRGSVLTRPDLTRPAIAKPTLAQPTLAQPPRDRGDRLAGDRGRRAPVEPT